MTLQLTTPNRIYSGVHDRMGHFLNDLKNDLVGSGLWEVTGSGDGDVAFANKGQTAGPSFDVFTNVVPYLSGYANNDLNAAYNVAGNKNSFSRPYAWLQLTEVGGTRTIQFRRASNLTALSSEQLGIKFCPGGVATTGATATKAPAAVGASWSVGGDPSTAGGSHSGAIAGDSTLRSDQSADAIVNILTAVSAAAKGVCPFVVLFAHAGVVRATGGFFYESLLQADDADLHPYIFRAATSSTMDYVFGGKTQDYGPFYTSVEGCYGASCVPWAFDTFRNVAMSGAPALPSGSSFLTPAVGTTWKSNAPRVRIAGGVSPGVAEHLRTNYVNRTYPDTFNLATTAPYVAAGMLVIPWKQNVAPVVGA